ncbi:MAG TPA: ATP-binding protein [Anaerolineae bacterium]|nr:response regulator [Anaerolineae bacterium]HRV91410.1 ATP-binding protein [Anaerolineae bacterium]
MTNQSSLSNRKFDLRQRAELLLKRQQEGEALIPTAEVHDLIQELTIYQIELELQNEELRRSEQKYQYLYQRYIDLFNLAPIGYIILNNKDRIQEINLTAAQMLGDDRFQLVGKQLTDYVAPDDQDIYYFQRRVRFAIGAPQSYQLRFSRADGVQFFAQIDSRPEKDKQGKVFGCRLAVTDITERKQAEAALEQTNTQLKHTVSELRQTQKQLIQQERLAAVGQLAAGIAHDFNNILTSILGFAELMKVSPDTPVSMQADLVYIIKSTNRATNLVRQILDFTQRNISQPKRFDLGTFTTEVTAFLNRIIAEDIHLTLSIEPGDYGIEADPTQIQQTLTNLVLNARDALSSGGAIEIKLGHRVFDDHHPPPLTDIQAGDWIVLTVSDSGPGISQEILPHIFEPFFTTKSVGKGTGLGLSQVYGIVKQHGGHIQVDSHEGRGATFTTYFPHISSYDITANAYDAPSLVKGHNETILVVEDDKEVLNTVSMLLKSLGYRVLPASNGKEALAIYQQHQRTVNLVLSDIVMPDMNGLALLAALQTCNPDIKMILMSGYPLNKEAATAIEQDAISWINKPMPLGKLSQIIGKTLESS